jgi:teichuronic acid biosynthesis glycosyltransferase TuaC
MRILFLTKQQYMGKDLVKDRFGRFYEIPRYLALSGNQVRVVCLKYRSTRDKNHVAKQNFDGVEWHSFRVGWNWPAVLAYYHRRLKEIADDFAPDVVVGASDAMHVIMAASLAARARVPLAIDLYDNFESYWATQLPGVAKGLKHGINQAAAVSAVSDDLAAKIRREYGAPGIVRTITNAVCPEIFHPADKASARRRLGLPESGVLIGTAGALIEERGIKTLYRAFEILSAKKSNLYLVLAGPVKRRLRIPQGDRVRYMGELPHVDVGPLFGALDVGVICNRQDEFGSYCFPQKFYEMLACRLPAVAANVGVMAKLLVGFDDCLYNPAEPESLTTAIERQLIKPHLANFAVPTWQDQGLEFHQLLAEALGLSRLTRASDSFDPHRVACSEPSEAHQTRKVEC